MPPRKKVNQLPEELQRWLKEELIARGFSGYEDLADELNFRLEESGLELRIGKSAVHSFGQEYEYFAQLQAEAGAWAEQWMVDNDLSDEAEQHRVLFQMMTSVAFKVLKSQMVKDGGEIDPRELHFLGKMMKDIMSSSGIREKLVSEERARIARETRESAAATAVKAAHEAGMSEQMAQNIKSQILGVS